MLQHPKAKSSYIIEAFHFMSWYLDECLEISRYLYFEQMESQIYPTYPPLSKLRKNAKIRNWYNQVPHLTQDITWESDKNTRKHLTQESQEVSPFPAGDHKAATNRQDSHIYNKTGQQKEDRLGTVGKDILLEALN